MGGSVRGGGGVRVDMNVEVKFFYDIFFFLGGGGSGWGGVRVDVNEELKFLRKFKKKKKMVRGWVRFVCVWGGGGVRGGFERNVGGRG